MTMLIFGDIFFTVFHTVYTLFNLFGWYWPATRKAHVVCLVLTFGAWAILGIWYGFGYCPLTDWHWDIKRALGAKHLPNSFIEYLLEQLFRTNIDPVTADVITVGGLLFGVIMAIYVNLIRPRQSRK